MNHVKYFGSHCTQPLILEGAVNNWLEKHKDYKIMNICSFGSGDFAICQIWYKVKK